MGSGFNQKVWNSSKIVWIQSRMIKEVAINWKSQLILNFLIDSAHFQSFNQHFNQILIKKRSKKIEIDNTILTLKSEPSYNGCPNSLECDFELSKIWLGDPNRLSLVCLLCEIDKKDSYDETLKLKES